jgi:hypothetical protein
MAIRAFLSPLDQPVRFVLKFVQYEILLSDLYCLSVNLKSCTDPFYTNLIV